MDTATPFYALLEFDCIDSVTEDLALQYFELCLEEGSVADGVISQSEAQAADLWRYREGISEAITGTHPIKMICPCVFRRFRATWMTWTSSPGHVIRILKCCGMGIWQTGICT